MAKDWNEQQLTEKIQQYVDWKIDANIRVSRDTTKYMSIGRGEVLHFQDNYYLILGNTHEARFGLDDPKYWVKKAIDLRTGAKKILKLVFHEEFIAHIGPLRIRCYRSPEKEAKVLETVKGDTRFMQGFSVNDTQGNNIRVIDFIPGCSLYEIIMELGIPHEQYLFTRAPELLKNALLCLEAIKFLHDNKLCHGDIRNDHIFIDQDSGQYRWIDFDLTQDYADFDVWSCGNIINFIVAKGIITFQDVYNTKLYPAEAHVQLSQEDASAFYKYRVMNLQKIFPYIPEKLNNVLLHFHMGAEQFYESLDPLIADLGEAVIDLETKC